MFKKLIKKIFPNIVEGPKLTKASNNKWEITNLKGNKYIVPFGVIVEKRENIVAKVLILGKWQIGISFLVD